MQIAAGDVCRAVYRLKIDSQREKVKKSTKVVKCATDLQGLKKLVNKSHRGFGA